VVLYPEKLTYGWTSFRGAGQREQMGVVVNKSTVLWPARLLIGMSPLL
jgi:hypothetical protein